MKMAIAKAKAEKKPIPKKYEKQMEEHKKKT